MSPKLQTSNSKLSLGFSPCPNDTFMFDALVNNRIETGEIRFEEKLLDVEQLNKRALNNELDVTKLSFAVYPHVADHYQLLTSGAALGFGMGPLLISKTSNFIPISNSVAIPGKHTTANFLLTIFFPQIKNKVEMLFSDIEEAVLKGKADAGVIIHENRFTYEKKGLKKIYDLGELWEKETGLPVPLGGIFIRRNLPKETKLKVQQLIKQSVQFAFEHPQMSREYVRQHSQEMEDEVIQNHINLYVNEYSIELKEMGRRAVVLLLDKAIEAGFVLNMRKDIFVEQMLELINC